MIALIIAGIVAGYLAALLQRRTLIRAAAADARRRALREASQLASEHADFELADTEDSSGQRLLRAQIAYDISVEIRGLS